MVLKKYSWPFQELYSGFHDNFRINETYLTIDDGKTIYCRWVDPSTAFDTILLLALMLNRKGPSLALHLRACSYL